MTNDKEKKMKKKKAVLLAVVLAVFLCSCASMYVRPTIETVLYRQQIPGTAAIVFKTAQYVLPLMKYKIEGSDPEAGTITTSPVEMTLGQGDCDCGSNLGLPVIKSRGTKVNVSFILGVTSNELTVRAEIVPVLDDLMSTLGSVANIVCVSKGGLEKAFAKKFVDNMAGNVLKMLFK
jgi:hypothetical protein